MDSSDEEPNLYLRKETNMLRTEVHNGWDDSMLVQAYDKAVSKAKEQIVRKLKKELNLDEEDVNYVLGNSVTLDSSPKHEKKLKKKTTLLKKWKVGDTCRCVYSEDGQEYEANIISVIDSKYCRVKYIGYGNEEEVLLKELAPSMGKAVIKAQMKMAELSHIDPEEEGEIISEPESTDESLPEMEVQSPRVYYPTKFPFAERVPMFSSTMPPPPQRVPMFSKTMPPPPQRVPMLSNMMPPPPLPPYSSFNDFDTMGPGSSTHSSRGEKHDAMLMSWFMCGYYTGYYAAEKVHHKTNDV